MPGWNVGPCCSDDNDVDFTREMIAAVEETACIDKKRVYATAFSMGGSMAHQVACSVARATPSVVMRVAAAVSMTV
jgi:polyhydroxybutyrate depolymerase